MGKKFFVKKNYLKCNSLIAKGMSKRRHLAIAAIYNLCENKQLLKVVK